MTTLTKSCKVTIDGVEHSLEITFDYSKLTPEMILEWAASKWTIQIQDKIRLGKVDLPEDGKLTVEVEEMGTRAPADDTEKLAEIIKTAADMGITLTEEQARIIYKKSKERKPKDK